MSNTWVYFPNAGWVQWLVRGQTGTAHGASIVLRNVHSALDCAGRECIIHSPKPRDTDDWPLLWRGDRAIFERICPHGTGHPDAAQFEYWHEQDEDWQRIHGCCIEHCTQHEYL